MKEMLLYKNEDLKFKEQFRQYSHTNESLNAITQGLDLKANDSVLAIGADQGFALLEYVKNVTICEYNPYYLNLIKKRKELLSQEKYDLFLNLDVKKDPKNFSINRRNKYFLKPGRMEKIKNKLKKLNVEGPVDIVNFELAHPNYSKLYLSNAIGGFSYSDSKKSVSALNSISQTLKPDNLIYVTAGIPSWEKKLPSKLIVDKYLSSKAKTLEYPCQWNPRVYRIISFI